MPNIQLTTDQVDRLVSLLDAYDDYDDIIDTILNQVPIPAEEQHIYPASVWMHRDHLFDRAARTLADVLVEEKARFTQFHNRVWLIGTVPGDARKLCFGWTGLSDAEQKSRQTDPPYERTIVGYYNSYFNVYRESMSDMMEYIQEHKEDQSNATPA